MFSISTFITSFFSAHILLKLTGKDVRQLAHCRIRDSLADLLVDLVAHLVGRIVDVAGDAATDTATARTTTIQVELGHIFYIILFFGLSIVVCVVGWVIFVCRGGRMIRYTIIQLIQWVNNIIHSFFWDFFYRFLNFNTMSD